LLERSRCCWRGGVVAPRWRGVASKHANVALDLDNYTDVVLERREKDRGIYYYLYCDLLVLCKIRVSKIFETSLSTFRSIRLPAYAFFLQKDSKDR
jgi:hypothetical protein